MHVYWEDYSTMEAQITVNLSIFGNCFMFFTKSSYLLLNFNSLLKILTASLRKLELNKIYKTSLTIKINRSYISIVLSTVRRGKVTSTKLTLMIDIVFLKHYGKFRVSKFLIKYLSCIFKSGLLT